MPRDPSDRPVAPHAVPVLLAVVLVIMGIFAGIVWAHWPWLEQAVAVEDAPVAWLQTSLLWSCATLALLLCTVEADRWRGWALVAAGLGAAALDERFMGHERLKDWLLFRWFDGDTGAMGPVGDLPLLVYAAGGIAAIAWLRRGGRRFAGMRWWVAALLATAAALALDIASQDLGVQVWEEAFELLAETLLLCGLLRHAQRVGPV